MRGFPDNEADEYGKRPDDTCMSGSVERGTCLLSFEDGARKGASLLIVGRLADRRSYLSSAYAGLSFGAAQAPTASTAAR